MKKAMVWIMIFVFAVSSNLLQGCATVPKPNTPFVKRDMSTITPLKVAHYETPQIDDTNPGLVIIGATLGAVLLMGVGAGLGAALALHKIDKEAPVPDFGNLVMTEFIERAGKEISQWPAMTVENEPITEDYSHKSGAILVIKVNGLAIHPVQGFMSGVVVTMKDSAENVLWEKDFSYVSKVFGREKSQDEYKENNFKLLNVEMEFAAEKTVADFMEHFKQGRAETISSVIEKPAPSPVAETRTSDVSRDQTKGMEMVFVKGGCYRMGDTFGDFGEADNDEKPVHEVCVDDFYIGKYEVTQGQWRAVMGNNPSYFKNCSSTCPVEQVSWNDVQDFIGRLNQRTGQRYRLPTEAEWEYAARSGGKQEKYAGGDRVDSVAWYKDNFGRSTHPVGKKRSNGLGIYDMSGNVWEWTQDRFDKNYYSNSPRNNPTGPSSDSKRVRRGGCWNNSLRHTRAANRGNDTPEKRLNGVGFRLVRMP